MFRRSPLCMCLVPTPGLHRQSFQWARLAVQFLRTYTPPDKFWNAESAMSGEDIGGRSSVVGLANCCAMIEQLTRDMVSTTAELFLHEVILVTVSHLLAIVFWCLAVPDRSTGGCGCRGYCVRHLTGNAFRLP